MYPISLNGLDFSAGFRRTIYEEGIRIYLEPVAIHEFHFDKFTGKCKRFSININNRNLETSSFFNDLKTENTIPENSLASPDEFSNIGSNHLRIEFVEIKDKMEELISHVMKLESRLRDVGEMLRGSREFFLQATRWNQKRVQGEGINVFRCHSPS